MRIITIYLLILWLPFNSIFYSYAEQVPYQAVTRTCVADLLGQSMKTITHYPIEYSYKKLPFCAKNPNACMRIHQLLLHEQVSVVEETNHEVCIRVPHIFFNRKNDASCNTLFWTLKKNIISLKKLKESGVNVSLLPEPISFDAKKSMPQTIVTLIKPYKDPKTHMLFSAGTRFVQAPHQSTNSSTSYAVYALHPGTNKIHIIHIPHDFLFKSSPHMSSVEKQKLFVAILKQWATNGPVNTCIPYVWGGCSFLGYIEDRPYETTQGLFGTCYSRPSKPHEKIHGFDCAGIIVRAAQIAGLPYFFKNSTTIAKHLQSLKRSERAQEGDIIWLPGHVMVISSTQNHTAIEARHYNHGYGKVHEIPIKNVFKNISTIDDLERAYFNHEPLYRVDSEHIVVQKIPCFKILSLQSIWKNP